MIQLFVVFNFNNFYNDVGQYGEEVVVWYLYRPYYPIG